MKINKSLSLSNFNPICQPIYLVHCLKTKQPIRCWTSSSYSRGTEWEARGLWSYDWSQVNWKMIIFVTLCFSRLSVFSLSPSWHRLVKLVNYSNNILSPLLSIISIYYRTTPLLSNSKVSLKSVWYYINIVIMLYPSSVPADFVKSSTFSWGKSI